MANENIVLVVALQVLDIKKIKIFIRILTSKLRSLMNEIKQFNNQRTVFVSISNSDCENIEVTLPPKQIVKN